MNDEDMKNSPIDELEFKQDVTRPQYIDGISKDYKDQSKRKKDSDEDNLERVFGFFTQDLRLGNLSSADMKRAEWFLNMAGRCSRLQLSKPFTSCLLKVASILELSQSHKGWLRKYLHTQSIKQEASISDDSNNKGWLFHKKRSSENSPYSMMNNRRW